MSVLDAGLAPLAGIAVPTAVHVGLRAIVAGVLAGGIHALPVDAAVRTVGVLFADGAGIAVAAAVHALLLAVELPIVTAGLDGQIRLEADVLGGDGRCVDALLSVVTGDEGDGAAKRHTGQAHCGLPDMWRPHPPEDPFIGA
ncbi:MAG: hypothetical protein GY913_15835 [Proteobacteria bacterium]|nr:hypothetical protein [Pseudomonadota bacterium]